MRIESWKALPEEEQRSAGVKLHKGYAADEVKIIEAERRIRFIISTNDVDRDRDTIDVEGWELEDYKRNPVVQWAHNYYQPPVARAVEITVSDGKLKSLAEFPDADVYPFADTVYRMIKAGYLNATSVGFRPMEWTINEERRGVDFKKQVLLEYSVVPIPANPHALVEARSNGTITEDDARLYLGWAEEVMDTWHGEKGLWLPKSQVEEAFKALSTKTTVDMGKTEAQPDEPEDTITETASDEPEMSLEDEEIEIDVLALLSLSESGDNHNEEPPDFFGLGADQLRGLVREVAGESLSDALKAEITATTGRLID